MFAGTWACPYNGISKQTCGISQDIKVSNGITSSSSNNFKHKWTTGTQQKIKLNFVLGMELTFEASATIGYSDGNSVSDLVMEGTTHSFAMDTRMNSSVPMCSVLSMEAYRYEGYAQIGESSHEKTLNGTCCSHHCWFKHVPRTFFHTLAP